MQQPGSLCGDAHDTWMHNSATTARPSFAITMYKNRKSWMAGMGKGCTNITYLEQYEACRHVLQLIDRDNVPWQ
eukprot:46746-Eustigmatos_ZCMA.PRE.1